MKLATVALGLAGLLSLAALAGCAKDSFCFDQCADEDGGGGTGNGGAFNSQDEDGASCDNVLYSVDSSFKLYDMGFRCCFDTNPM